MRLHLRIFGAFLIIVVACVLTAGLVGRAVGQGWGALPGPIQSSAELIVEQLPQDPSARQRDVQALGKRLGIQLTLLGPDGQLQAAAGEPLALPRRHRASGWMHPGGPGLYATLSDGSVLLAAAPAGPGADRAPLRPLLVLGVLALVMGLGTYPLARGVTRRLEALREGAERWGQGDLSARVELEGSDEVAQVAASFNAAAEQVQSLVQTQRRMLASASHELRSPLARVRMAVELMGDGDPEREELAQGAASDIAELDELIGDLLLAARLEGDQARSPQSLVDLSALFLEEALRVEARVVIADGVTLHGEPRMLRRMLRNLLENARRHGGGEVEARLSQLDGTLTLQVADDGPGVPEALRERIFEPFYRPEGHSEGADGGVGLGLFLVRRIARHHGGEVQALGADGGGGRFVVTLPMVPPDVS